MAFPAQSSVSPIYEVFPDVPERWRTAHQRGLAGEVVIAQEDYFERLDGRMQWLRWEIHPWYTSGMDVGGIFIFAEEITSRKQAEEALRRSEALYRAIGESIDYGVWICSPDGRNTYASESFLKLVGLTQAQCSDFGWGNVLHPDDAERTIAAWQECVRTAGTWDIEHRIRGADGQWHHILARGVPVKDAQGRILSWAGINLDISRLKRSEEALVESEERFRTLADNMSQLAWMADATGSLTWYNRRWYEYTGTTFEQMRGWGWEQVHHPDHLRRVVEKWKQAHRTGEAWEDTFPLRGKDGAYRWFLSRALPIRDGAGHVVRWFGTNTDVTALRQAQEALRESEERLRSFAGQLEQLVDERTEELVQSEARLRALASELNLTEQRERKRLALELHDHLAQMLVLSKLKMSQMKQIPGLVPTCLELITQSEEVLAQSLTYTRTLVADLAPPVLHDFGLPAALKWLSEQLARHDLAVAVHLSHDKLALPEQHAMLLFQSVRELLMNAAKHAGTHEAVVSLEQRPGELRILVRDEGKGFDSGEMAEGSAAVSRSSKFGLFSIRERMRALGGALKIESALGKGTQATLTVPLADHVEGLVLSPEPLGAASNARSTNPLKAQHTALPGGSSPGTHRPSGIRVLLVDDHTMVRQGLRSILESYADIDVVGEAANGEEAVAAAERLRPAIVVMDINMPKMNGVEATIRIKAQDPESRIIGLSVNAEGENQTAMLTAGASLLLTKEAAFDELYRAIQDVLAPHPSRSSAEGVRPMEKEDGR